LHALQWCSGVAIESLPMADHPSQPVRLFELWRIGVPDGVASAELWNHPLGWKGRLLWNGGLGWGRVFDNPGAALEEADATRERLSVHPRCGAPTA
jgi:hypothetical protein